jgi:peptidoglycan/xylan/chitin deacetylase (PgdA/CDA1 family)
LIKNKAILIICLLSILFMTGCYGAAGSDTPDLPPPSPLSAPVLTPNSKLVAIYFDDGFRNQYEQALPVMVKCGFRVTFGIITGSIGKGHGLMAYMNKQELEVLAQYGMEIASHTKTHVDLTGNLSDKQYREQIIDSKKDLEKMGFTINTLVYPYFSYNEKAVEYAREAGYTCARAGWTTGYTYDLSSNDILARYHINAAAITDQDIETFNELVSKSSPTCVVSLVYHLISDDGPASTSTPVNNFYEQMTYLAENGYTIVILSELMK